MYEGKIVAEAAITAPADVQLVAVRDDATGSALVGVVILLVGLPLLAVRLFAYVLVRDARRLIGLARLVSTAYGDARRS